MYGENGGEGERGMFMVSECVWGVRGESGGRDILMVGVWGECRGGEGGMLMVNVLKCLYVKVSME